MTQSLVEDKRNCGCKLYRCTPLSLSLSLSLSLLVLLHRGALHRQRHDFTAAVDDFLKAMDKCGHQQDSQVYCSASRQLVLTYNDFAVECFR